jgi:predicted ester cyclase
MRRYEPAAERRAGPHPVRYGREQAMSRGSANARADHGTDPQAQVRRLVEEVCSKGDLAVLDEMVATSAEPGAATRLRPLLAAFRAAVPDACWTIMEQLAAGDVVVTRLAVQGTFSGPLLGLAPPGRPATLTGVAISRFAHGRLVDLWVQADLLGFLQQLRVLPPLDLTQAVAMAEVARTGALLMESSARQAEPAGAQLPPPGGGPCACEPAPNTRRRPAARVRRSRRRRDAARRMRRTGCPPGS